MAKKSMKNRELKRQLTVAKFAKKRAELSDHRQPERLS